MSEWKETYIGTIPIDWNIFNLGDLGEFKNGINFSREDFGKGYPIINVKNLFDGRFVSTLNLDEVLKNRISNSSSYLLNRKDILFARSSVTVEGAGQVSMIDKLPAKECVYSGFIIRFRITKQNVIYPDFLNYLLRSSKYRSYLVKVASGTAIINLSQDVLKNIPIHVPSFDEQKQIADILSCLDNKIDNLRRQNETLEKIAQTLFKHWFIDFEFPNDDGKPYKSSGGAMVASELGDIPEGWRVESLEQEIKIQKGLSYKGAGLSDEKSGIPMHNLKSVYEGGGYQHEGIKFYNSDYKKHHICYARDLIVPNTEQGEKHKLIGFPARIPSYFKDVSILTHHLFLIRPLNTSYLTNEYIYYLLYSHLLRKQILGYTNGTTVNMLSPDGLKKPIFPKPPQELISNFSQVIKPVWDKFENNIQQIQTLTKTRDALLPKLMSGQIRVKEGESIIEEE